MKKMVKVNGQSMIGTIVGKDRVHENFLAELLQQNIDLDDSLILEDLKTHPDSEKVANLAVIYKGNHYFGDTPYNESWLQD